MDYEIRIELNRVEIKTMSCIDCSGAVKRANKIIENGVKYSGYDVYVRWFQEDGEPYGFLNPDGEHEFIGQNWNK